MRSPRYAHSPSTTATIFSPRNPPASSRSSYHYHNGKNPSIVSTSSSKALRSNELIEYQNGIYHGATHLTTGERSGLGIYAWDSGEVYFGEWKKDRIEGEGMLFLPQGGFVHGYFSKGRLSGAAFLKLSNDDINEGFFREGLLEGNCYKYSTSSNAWTLSDYKNGQLNQRIAKGLGLPPSYVFGFITSAGEIAQRHEKHARIPLQCVRFPDGGQYLGLLRKGMPSSLGIFRYNDDKYDVGIYKEGSLNGVGRMHMHNGDIYDGRFVNGAFHGRGLLFESASGEWVHGEFIENQCVKEIRKGYDGKFPAQIALKIRAEEHLKASKYVNKSTSLDLFAVMPEDDMFDSLVEHTDEHDDQIGGVGSSDAVNNIQTTKKFYLDLSEKQARESPQKGGLASEELFQQSPNRNDVVAYAPILINQDSSQTVNKSKHTRQITLGVETHSDENSDEQQHGSDQMIFESIDNYEQSVKKSRRSRSPIELASGAGVDAFVAETSQLRSISNKSRSSSQQRSKSPPKSLVNHNKTLLNMPQQQKQVIQSMLRNGTQQGIDSSSKLSPFQQVLNRNERGNNRRWDSDFNHVVSTVDDNEDAGGNGLLVPAPTAVSLPIGTAHSRSCDLTTSATGAGGKGQKLELSKYFVEPLKLRVNPRGSEQNSRESSQVVDMSKLAGIMPSKRNASSVVATATVIDVNTMGQQMMPIGGFMTADNSPKKQTMNANNNKRNASTGPKRNYGNHANQESSLLDIESIRSEIASFEQMASQVMPERIRRSRVKKDYSHDTSLTPNSQITPNSTTPTHFFRQKAYSQQPFFQDASLTNNAAATAEEDIRLEEDSEHVLDSIKQIKQEMLSQLHSLETKQSSLPSPPLTALTAVSNNASGGLIPISSVESAQRTPSLYARRDQNLHLQVNTLKDDSYQNSPQYQQLQRESKAEYETFIEKESPLYLDTLEAKKNSSEHLMTKYYTEEEANLIAERIERNLTASESTCFNNFRDIMNSNNNNNNNNSNMTEEERRMNSQPSPRRPPLSTNDSSRKYQAETLPLRHELIELNKQNISSSNNNNNNNYSNVTLKQARTIMIGEQEVLSEQQQQQLQQYQPIITEQMSLMTVLTDSSAEQQMLFQQQQQLQQQQRHLLNISSSDVVTAEQSASEITLIKEQQRSLFASQQQCIERLEAQEQLLYHIEERTRATSGTAANSSDPFTSNASPRLSEHRVNQQYLLAGAGGNVSASREILEEEDNEEDEISDLTSFTPFQLQQQQQQQNWYREAASELTAAAPINAPQMKKKQKQKINTRKPIENLAVNDEISNLHQQQSPENLIDDGDTRRSEQLQPTSNTASSGSMMISQDYFHANTRLLTPARAVESASQNAEFNVQQQKQQPRRINQEDQIQGQQSTLLLPTLLGDSHTSSSLRLAIPTSASSKLIGTATTSAATTAEEFHPSKMTAKNTQIDRKGGEMNLVNLKGNSRAAISASKNDTQDQRLTKIKNEQSHNNTNRSSAALIKTTCINKQQESQQFKQPTRKTNQPRCLSPKLDANKPHQKINSPSNTIRVLEHENQSNNRLPRTKPPASSYILEQIPSQQQPQQQCLSTPSLPLNAFTPARGNVHHLNNSHHGSNTTARVVGSDTVNSAKRVSSVPDQIHRSNNNNLYVSFGQSTTGLLSTPISQTNPLVYQSQSLQYSPIERLAYHRVSPSIVSQQQQQLQQVQHLLPIGLLRKQSPLNNHYYYSTPRSANELQNQRAPSIDSLHNSPSTTPYTQQHIIVPAPTTTYTKRVTVTHSAHVIREVRFPVRSISLTNMPTNQQSSYSLPSSPSHTHSLHVNLSSSNCSIGSTASIGGLVKQVSYSCSSSPSTRIVTQSIRPSQQFPLNVKTIVRKIASPIVSPRTIHSHHISNIVTVPSTPPQVIVVHPVSGQIRRVTSPVTQINQEQIKDFSAIASADNNPAPMHLESAIDEREEGMCSIF